MLSRKILNLFIIVVFLFLTVLFINSCSNSKESNSKVSSTEPYIQAKVIKIISDITLEDKVYNTKLSKVRLLVRLLDGPDKNQDIEIENQVSSDAQKIIVPKKGDVVILAERMLADETTSLQIVDYKRSNVILFSIVILLALLIWVAGKKGFVFFSYLFSIILVSTFVFLPLVFWGINLVIITLLLAIAISSLTIYINVNIKSEIKYTIFSNVFSLILITIYSTILVKLGYFNTFPLIDASVNYFPVSINQMIISMIILSTLGCIINMSIYATNLSNNLFKKFAEKKLSKLNLSLMAFKNSRNNIFFNFIMMFLIYFALSVPLILTSYNRSTSYVLNTSTFTFYVIALSASAIGIVCSCFTSSFMTFHYLIESSKPKKTFNNRRSLRKSNLAKR